MVWQDIHWDKAEVRNPTAQKEFFDRCRSLGGHLTTNVPMLELDDGQLDGEDFESFQKSCIDFGISEDIVLNQTMEDYEHFISTFGMSYGQIIRY